MLFCPFPYWLRIPYSWNAQMLASSCWIKNNKANFHMQEHKALGAKGKMLKDAEQWPWFSSSYLLENSKSCQLLQSRRVLLQLGFWHRWSCRQLVTQLGQLGEKRLHFGCQVKGMKLVLQQVVQVLDLRWHIGHDTLWNLICKKYGIKPLDVITCKRRNGKYQIHRFEEKEALAQNKVDVQTWYSQRRHQILAWRTTCTALIMNVSQGDCLPRSLTVHSYDNWSK